MPHSRRTFLNGVLAIALLAATEHVLDIATAPTPDEEEPPPIRAATAASAEPQPTKTDPSGDRPRRGLTAARFWSVWFGRVWFGLEEFYRECLVELCSKLCFYSPQWCAVQTFCGVDRSSALCSGLFWLEPELCERSRFGLVCTSPEWLGGLGLLRFHTQKPAERSASAGFSWCPPRGPRFPRSCEPDR